MLPPVRAMLLAAAGVAGSAMAPGLAHAAPQECFAAVDEAQTLRDEGHYAAARERLATCSAADCPAVIQRDCSQWMEQLVQLWPTILVNARDLVGRDLADVKVSVDGKVVTDRLDGRPLQIDPGEHRLLCETAGAPPVEQTIVVRASEKNREIAVQFSKGAPVVVAPPIEPRVDVIERPRETPPSQDLAGTLRWVFGGAALAAFGTAAYFGFTGLSRYNQLQSTCAGAMDCHPSDVSFTQSHFLVSDISVGLGLASAAAATYFFLTARRSQAPRAGFERITPQVVVGSSGASFGAGGVF
jgi:hypothetical protein